MTHTKEEIKKMFEEMPEELGEVLYSDETEKTLFEIGQKYGLNIEKSGRIIEVVTDIFIGLKSVNEIITELTIKLEIETSVAEKIAGEINEQILKEVKDILIKDREKDITEEGEDKNSLIEEIEIHANKEVEKEPSKPEKILNEVDKKEEGVSARTQAWQVVSSVGEKKETIMTDTSLQNKDTKQPNYSVDPYREPIK